MGLIIVTLLALAAPAAADTNVKSYRDSLGYIHSDVKQNGKRMKCLTRTDSLGYVQTDCHRN